MLEAHRSLDEAVVVTKEAGITQALYEYVGFSSYDLDKDERDGGLLGERAHPLWAWLLRELGLKALWNVRVEHCRHAFALVVEGAGEAPWKLAYSGDTRPCERLAREASGATVLVHEATFEPDRPDEEREKRHSTTAEAVSVGEASGAARVVLTHFSQRYPKIPALPPDERGAVCVAFDLMRVTFRDLLWAPRLTPVLQRLFDEAGGQEAEEDEPEEEDSCRGKRGRGEASGRAVGHRKRQQC